MKYTFVIIVFYFLTGTIFSILTPLNNFFNNSKLKHYNNNNCNNPIKDESSHRRKNKATEKAYKTKYIGLKFKKDGWQKLRFTYLSVT